LIIESSLHGSEALHNAANQIGMPLTTARRIIRQHRTDSTYIRPKLRGGAHHRLYDQQVLMSLLTLWIEKEDNYYSSLDNIHKYLQDEVGIKPTPSRTTLSKWLDGHLMILNYDFQETDFDNIDQMHSQLMQFDSNVVFVGEFAASLWTKRSRTPSISSNEDGIIPVVKKAREITENCWVAFMPGSNRLLVRVGLGFEEFIEECSVNFLNPEFNQPLTFFFNLQRHGIDKIPAELRVFHNFVDAAANSSFPNFSGWLINQCKPVMRQVHQNFQPLLTSIEDLSLLDKQTIRQQILHEIVTKAWILFRNPLHNIPL